MGAAFSIAVVTLVAGCRSAPPSRSERARAEPAHAPTESQRRAALALAEVRGASRTELQIRELQRRVRARPDSEDAWLLLGRAWVRRAREASDPGHYLSAEACANELLARAPEQPAARNLLGLVLLNRHDFSAAKALAEAVLARDPRDAMAWGTLSDAELELGDFDAAVHAADRMLEQKPGLPAYSRASYLRFLRGDLDGAVATIRLAIDAGLDPNDPEPLAWTLVQAAELFWQQGDYAGAGAGFQQALEVVPDYPAALAGRGRVALAEGDPARAARLLRRALEQSPLLETACWLADALAEAGDTSGAQQALERAEREGLRGDARALSLFYSTRGKNLARALELARAERRVRGDVYTEDALAWAYYKNGAFELARQSSDRAVRLGTPDARLAFHRGAILLATGEVRRGRELLRETLARHPKFDRSGAAEARRLLGGGA
ncbi:MAG TPA: tetratricopeptide repeat protein [Polyangiaceae bacterium]